MKYAFFDLSGTVLKYATNRPIPLMPEIMKAMDRAGWKIAIVSNYLADDCKALLENTKLTFKPKILSSAYASKGEILKKELQRKQSDQIIFVDDKPSNLASVMKHCGDKVRIIGFVGSGKYVPQLSDWCAEHKIELALSPSDLCEGLPVSLEAYDILNADRVKYSEKDLVSLIPGLDHPMSSTTGETRHFDHRAVFSALFNGKRAESLKDYKRFWRAIAWITCNECQWKALVQSACAYAELPVEGVIGDAYKHYEYTDTLKKYVAAHPCNRLRRTFEVAMGEMKTGINEIGVTAESCRIGKSNRRFERDRIQKNEMRIADCFATELEGS